MSKSPWHTPFGKVVAFASAGALLFGVFVGIKSREKDDTSPQGFDVQAFSDPLPDENALIAQNVEPYTEDGFPAEAASEAEANMEANMAPDVDLPDYEPDEVINVPRIVDSEPLEGAEDQPSEEVVDE